MYGKQMASLEGKVALVTGASSGMGEEITKAMAAAGAAVAAVGRNEERLERVVAEAHGDGGEVFAIARDLTADGAAQAVVDEAVERMGKLDILANVAGIMELGPLGETPVESLDRQFRTNVRAPFELTQAALPHLREAKGAIIFISSMAALAAFPESAAYTATKGAIDAVARQLAVELAPQGVRVNAIAPGEIDTPMNTEFYAEHPEFVEEMEEFTPAGRLGKATDIAPAAVFLVSDMARFVYGVSLPVDGGIVAR
ncbi:MAG TPA: glucose 1-dehydrogenase [Thermoleophilaceae bacterium]|nr:glucose 1-dehydrogenase [Thermoleophilaceae bacterium]